MLDLLRDQLAAQPLTLLFATVGLGFILSHLRFRGVTLGVAAVLFVGLALGAWGGHLFQLPEIVSQLGLLLFVYAIGLQAGPSFFRILGRQGWGIASLALSAVLLGGAVAFLAAWGLKLDPALAVGLFCGGMTNTPALAAATAALHGTPRAALPTVGYSIAYPLGVAIPILLAELVARLGRVNIPEATRRAERDAEGFSAPPAALNLEVTNPALDEVALGATPLAQLPVWVSRVARLQHQSVATPESVIKLGDVLRIVGTTEALAEAQALVGTIAEGPGPEVKRDEVDFRRIILTNAELVGRKVRDLGLTAHRSGVITRVRRGDQDFMPSPETVLERGDRLRVVARVDQLDEITRYLGDSLRALRETDFLSLSLGVVLGLMLGQLKIPLPGAMNLQLGLAGGPLVAALVLGAWGRSGPIIWTLPPAANLALRQLGLVLFFAAVGLNAGGHFGGALTTQGPALIGAGAVITLLSTLLLLGGAMKLLKADWVTATGLLAGGQTQPALLAFAGDRSHSEAPNVAYVAIMPTAMLAKILLAQGLLWIMLR